MENNLSQNKKALFWLNIGHFINDIYTGVLNPVMPFVAAKIGISMAIATIVLTVSHIFSSLLQPIFGFWADNNFKRLFVFWGLILSSLFIPISVTSNNVIALVLFIIFGSLGSSFFHPQALGFVSKFSKDFNSSMSMSAFIAMGTLGYSFGPIISGGITQAFGLEKMPYLSIFGIAWALLMFKCVPKISDTVKKNKDFDFYIVFKRILSNKRLNILNVIAMLKTVIQSSCFIFLPFLWKDMGHTPVYIGVALFLFIFAGGIGSFMSSFAEKFIGTKNVFYISMISTFPLMILFVLTYRQNTIISTLIFLLMGFLTMLATPITMLLAQNSLPEYKSIISGFINGFSWGVVAIAISILGFVAENFGITNVLIAIATIPAICSIPLVKKLFTLCNQ